MYIDFLVRRDWTGWLTELNVSRPLRNAAWLGYLQDCLAWILEANRWRFIAGPKPTPSLLSVFLRLKSMCSRVRSADYTTINNNGVPNTAITSIFNDYVPFYRVYPGLLHFLYCLSLEQDSPQTKCISIFSTSTFSYQSIRAIFLWWRRDRYIFIEISD